MEPKITYQPSQTIGKGFRQMMHSIIQHYQVEHVCEVGAGANPLFPPDTIRNLEIRYTALDISSTELDKAAPEYSRIVADISARDFSSPETFDLVFSKMLTEHVNNAEQFHRNVLSMLSPGGIAVHFFPTLYTLPFTLNLLTPERLSSFLLSRLAPRDSYQRAKFPAYYQWCRGPLSHQIQRFNHLGYHVVEYQGYFGHPNYYQKLKFIQRIHLLKTRYLLNHPVPWLTSYACVILKKSN